ncbi:hypothetical protein D5039_11425 [Verminephrobacter aporrectodeae subsp. tuberculatae]|uniref:Transcriptional regulator n=1 Tax=Verminephrobacter aporrectodeae subsp. tuberculatae TaxID=1110392 RepID=A0ABT3KVB6_9BURK|nr:PhaM family polyhydroxyalkanoate granule multifunctional regulatory protein [Verminephrobacter aporrectodeae]MCW5321740.1 hypothetical protein [Verminephrobacter aporrectodeae subsp. tuberculatae]
MSDTSNFDFGKFVPGFDFLQSLVKGASSSFAQLPKLSNWVAPTLSVEELDKRIEELKVVQFWLEQNSRALAATVQALEVQKMTLATLKGMNFSMGDVAHAFNKPRTADSVGATAQATQAEPAAVQAPAKPGAADADKPAVVDPMQWWGALTSQFQQIAANALKDATRQTSASSAENPTGPARQARKTASSAPAGASAAQKPAAATKKVAGRKPAAKPTPRSNAARKP